MAQQTVTWSIDDVKGYVKAYLPKSSTTYNTSLNKLKDNGFSDFLLVLKDPINVATALKEANVKREHVMSIFKTINIIVNHVQSSKDETVSNKLKFEFASNLIKNYTKEIINPLFNDVKLPIEDSSIQSDSPTDIEDEDIDINELNKKLLNHNKTVSRKKKLTKQNNNSTLKNEINQTNTEELIVPPEIVQQEHDNETVRELKSEVKRLQTLVNGLNEKVEFLTNLVLPTLEFLPENIARSQLQALIKSKLTVYPKPN